MTLGRPEEGLDIYERLVKPDQPEERPPPPEARYRFLDVPTSRNSKEYLRIAAYSALAELNLPDQQSILEDGLLDSSPRLCGQRGLEGLSRAGLAAQFSNRCDVPCKTTCPPVRIAAMNVLSEARMTAIMPRLVEKVARTEDGPEAVFAYAALYRLGKRDMLVDITGAATLPDPETRMAALGVLGRLKHSSSLAVLSQGVYDPEPQVRAFAAGALGELGQPDAVAPLTHALGDEIRA